MINIGISWIVSNERNKIVGTLKRIVFHGSTNVKMHQINNGMGWGFIGNGWKRILMVFAHITMFTKWKLSKMWYNKHNGKFLKKFFHRKNIQMVQPMVPSNSFTCIFIYSTSKTRKLVLTYIGRCGITSCAYKI